MGGDSRSRITRNTERIERLEKQFDTLLGQCGRASSLIQRHEWEISKLIKDEGDEAEEEGNPRFPEMK